jgi:hypothetical protein
MTDIFSRLINRKLPLSSPKFNMHDYSLADTQFGWRHRPDRFRGGWWDEMSTRASQGRDASTDEKNDAEIAEAAELERHRRMNRMGGDIWMAA